MTLKWALSVLLFVSGVGAAVSAVNAWKAEMKAEQDRTAYAEAVSSDDGVAVATGLTNATLFVAIPHAGQAECDYFADVIVHDRVEVKQLREQGFNKVQCLDAVREIK